MGIFHCSWPEGNSHKIKFSKCLKCSLHKNHSKIIPNLCCDSLVRGPCCESLFTACQAPSPTNGPTLKAQKKCRVDSSGKKIGGRNSQGHSCARCHWTKDAAGRLKSSMPQMLLTSQAHWKGHGFLPGHECTLAFNGSLAWGSGSWKVFQAEPWKRLEVGQLVW